MDLNEILKFYSTHRILYIGGILGTIFRNVLQSIGIYWNWNCKHNFYSL